MTSDKNLRLAEVNKQDHLLLVLLQKIPRPTFGLF